MLAKLGMAFLFAVLIAGELGVLWALSIEMCAGSRKTVYQLLAPLMIGASALIAVLTYRRSVREQDRKQAEDRSRFCFDRASDCLQEARRQLGEAENDRSKWRLAASEILTAKNWSDQIEVHELKQQYEIVNWRVAMELADTLTWKKDEAGGGTRALPASYFLGAPNWSEVTDIDKAAEEATEGPVAYWDGPGEVSPATRLRYLDWRSVVVVFDFVSTFDIREGDPMTGVRRWDGELFGRAEGASKFVRYMRDNTLLGGRVLPNPRREPAQRPNLRARARTWIESGLSRMRS